jgi:hypothetical protein
VSRQAKRQAQPGGLGAHHAKAQLLSNKTHYSPTDPEARISVKPGKARALNYLCSLAVDTATGVISHIQADLADSRDCLHLPALVPRLQARLRAQELTLRDFVADTGYSNGFNYAFLEQRGITPWIPVFGPYKPTVEGFTYESAADAYCCRGNKLLPFRSFRTTENETWVKQYRAAYQDCQQCPLKASCVPHSQFKQVIRSAFDAAYRRAWHRQRSPQGQHLRRVRQRTVEPIFGSLLQHYGLRRVNTKGRAAAHKTMLITAIAYNLKKLLKQQSTRILSLALALRPAQHGLMQALCSRRLLTGYRFQSALESGRQIAWSSATATPV